MKYFNGGGFGTGAGDLWSSTPGWGSGEEYGGSLANALDQGSQVFAQSFKNLVGRDPTIDELGAFQTQALYTGGVEKMGYSDLSNLANNFVQNSFSPQIAQHQQDAQQQQLGKTQQTVQDLIKQQTQAVGSDILNPKSQTYQTMAGQANNLGYTPASGAFQSGLGSVLGQNAANSINAALGAVTLPAISGIQGLTSYPMSVGQQFNDLSHINQLQDFQLQSDLAKQLSESSGPSGAQSMLGMATGAAGGAGGLLQGGAAAKNSTSYVCMELIKRGLLCESDMDDFHVHIMPAMFKKGRAFWKYAMDGKRLVDAVNVRGLDWKPFKPLLFDRVMEESDPCKAVDLYADACHQLCISADRSLWDKRVYRESLLDSLPFLPRLFLYTPFLKALWKCFRIKTLILYDKPTCGLHR